MHNLSQWESIVSNGCYAIVLLVVSYCLRYRYVTRIFTGPIVGYFYCGIRGDVVKNTINLNFLGIYWQTEQHSHSSHQESSDCRHNQMLFYIICKVPKCRSLYQKTVVYILVYNSSLTYDIRLLTTVYDCRIAIITHRLTLCIYSTFCKYSFFKYLKNFFIKFFCK